jgi:hypothetical protein
MYEFNRDSVYKENKERFGDGRGKSSEYKMTHETRAQVLQWNKQIGLFSLGQAATISDTCMTEVR